MTSAVYARTSNMGLGLLEFNFPNWGDDSNNNMKILDTVIGIGLGISNIVGLWVNNHAYLTNEQVVDGTNNTLWRSMEDHTSPALGSFEDDRTANPDRWAPINTAATFVGFWQSGVDYENNDFLFDANRYGVVKGAYTSGASYDDDVAAEHIVTLIDLTISVSAAEDAIVTAQAASDASAASAASAAGSAVSADLSADNALASATAAAGSASDAAASAAAAALSEADAETAAGQALSLFNAMMPDAPIDGEVYGRMDETWTKVIGDAPLTGIAYGRQSGNWVPSVAYAVVSDAPPTVGLSNGLMWLESDTGLMYMYYVDIDSSQWIQIGGGAGLTGGSGGGISEAPTDSKTYGRRNNAWQEIAPSGGVPEAPFDGKQYVRQDGDWVEVDIPVLPAMPFSFDPVGGDAILKFGSDIVVRIKASGLILTENDIEVFSTSVG